VVVGQFRPAGTAVTGEEGDTGSEATAAAYCVMEVDNCCLSFCSLSSESRSCCCSRLTCCLRVFASFSMSAAVGLEPRFLSSWLSFAVVS